MSVVYFSCLTQALCANTVVHHEAFPSQCLAKVLVTEQQLIDEQSEQGVISVYRSLIRKVNGCPNYEEGDELYLSAPGGLSGQYRIAVNGLGLTTGQEAIVQFTTESSSLGTPILLRANANDWPRPEHGFNCSRAGPNGPSLFWQERTVVMHPAIAEASASANDLTDAIHWAADQWSNTRTSDFRFQIGEPVSQLWTGYDWSEAQPNFNIVTLRTKSGNDFYSEWLHAAKALAITTVTYIHRTGEIVDADVELNGFNFVFTNCKENDFECVTNHDLKNTLTHEFGHVLGLEHADPSNPLNISSVMFEESYKGETKKRFINKRDVRALSYIYPKGEETRECYGIPRGSPPEIYITQYSGCTQNASPGPGNSFMLGSLLLLFLFKHFYRFIGAAFPARSHPCSKIKSKLPLMLR